MAIKNTPMMTMMIVMIVMIVKILTRKNTGTSTAVNDAAATSMVVSGLLAMVAHESRVTLEPAETMTSLDTGGELAVATPDMGAAHTDESRAMPEAVEMRMSIVAVGRLGLGTELERLSASLDILEAAEMTRSMAAAARLVAMGRAALMGVKRLRDMAAVIIPTVRKQAVGTAPPPMDETPPTPTVPVPGLVAMVAMTMITRAMAAPVPPMVVTKVSRCPADLETTMKAKAMVALVTVAMVALPLVLGTVAAMVVSRCLVGLAVTMMKGSDVVAMITSQACLCGADVLS